MTTTLQCFTAYDVRGKIPDAFNADMGALIALAFAEHFAAKTIVVGRDMRLSSPEIAEAVIARLMEGGAAVIDIGLCGTEELYHAVFSGERQGVDGGIMITASHNPADYNGMKIVQRGARPVSETSGLQAIAGKLADENWLATMRSRQPETVGSRVGVGDKSAYLEHLLSCIDVKRLQPMRIVVNAGNGCAGPVIDLLEQHLPFSFFRLHHEPDGSFPNGVPNPLLPEGREVTSQAVLRHGAHFGVAWDGDFDRCFFYDENGRFIEGYFIVGLLGAAILDKHPGATILHDPRLVWNTREVISDAGGTPVMTRTGHAFFKEKMREVDAVYGGEMSAHHYFRDFGYCDSGMLPWLLVAELICVSGRKLSTMVDECMAAFPVSGEINSRVADPNAVLARIEEHYQGGEVDYTDGISIAFPSFRFNVRKSNTEPVLRLNVESRGDQELLTAITSELLQIIRG